MSEDRIDPFKLHAELLRLGEDWADKDAAANLLEETKKTLLGDITNRLLVTMEAHNAAEKAALSHKDYKEHIKLMVEAKRVANRAKVRYEGHKTLIEMLRSVNSYNREAMKSIGITP